MKILAALFAIGFFSVAIALEFRASILNLFRRRRRDLGFPVTRRKKSLRKKA